MKLINKIKSSKGFTLIEMTVTLITVTIVTSLFLILVSFVKNVYIEMQQISEGQILCSTLTSAVQDELRYASFVKTIEADENDDMEGYYAFTYYSESLGVGSACYITYVENDDDGDASTLNKHILTIKNKDTNKLYNIVSPESYVFNLEAYVEAWYNPDLKQFYVTIRVADARYENSSLIESNFYIDPLTKKGL